MLPNSKILFDVIIENIYTTEARIMVYIAAVREAYKKCNIPNIGFIFREYNVADGLTKIDLNLALRKLLKFHRINHPIEHYVMDC